MKFLNVYNFCLLLLFFIEIQALDEKITEKEEEIVIEIRNPKFFNNWFDSWGPRCTGCPARGCLRDRAVNLGYCCGCARVSDNMPIECPRKPNCPIDGRKLCKDYDYMMDCCCP